MNEGDQAVQLIYLAGVLVLVVSALLVRRIPIGQGVKMLAAWVLIFAAAFVIFTMKDDFIALWERVVLEARGGVVQEQHGEELRVRRSGDGHFWVDAELNGEPVRFLIDSGATTTSISPGAPASSRAARFPPWSRRRTGSSRCSAAGRRVSRSARSNGATSPSTSRNRSET